MSGLLSLMMLMLPSIRPVRGARGAIPSTPPDFGISVEPISTRRLRHIMPPHHYWHPRIFRPSYGPQYVCVVIMQPQSDLTASCLTSVPV